MTSAIGGQLKSGAEVTGWKAEVFIPYELLAPSQRRQTSGTRGGPTSTAWTTTTEHDKLGLVPCGAEFPRVSKVWEAGV